MALFVDGTAVVTTAAAQDTTTPSWSASGTRVIPAGVDLQTQVWDEDLTSNDLMFGCTASPLTVDFIRGRTIACRADGALTGASVVIAIDRI